MKQIHVLVIEDDLTMSRMIETALSVLSEQENYRYIVTCAFDGMEGLECLSKECPDIILLDINLPKLSGHEVLQALRAQGNTVPVIMMSGTGSTDDVLKGLRAGCDAYIAKPFSIHVLYSCIQDQVSRKARRPLIINS